MARYEDVFILKDKVSDKLLDMTISMEKFNKKLGNTKERLEFFRKETENIAKLGNKIKDVGKGLTVGLTLPIVAAGGAAVKAASDYEEALNKVDVAFGNNSKVVKDWSKNSLNAMGLSKGQALDSAALFGDMATGMGLSQEKASQMAMRLTQLGADLSSFKNVSNDVAQTALKSIFTGETESLKNLGVVMTETNLQQYAYSKGIRKKIKSMTEAEKVNLRYNYVLEKTKNAHGDFERTGGGAANQLRIFQNSLRELGETFGQHILPTFTKVLHKINGMLKAFAQLPAPVQKGIIVFGAILAVIGPLVTVIGSVIAAVNGLSIAFAFLAANPIILVIGAVAAALVFCYKKFEGFRKIVQAVWALIKLLGVTIAALAIKFWDWIKPVAEFGKAFLMWATPIGVIVNLLKFLWSLISKVVGGLDSLIQKAGGFRGIGSAIIDWANKSSENVKKWGNTNNNTTNNTTNTTNITNNNYSAGANPKNAKYTK